MGYRPQFWMDVTHPGLGKYRRVRGSDKYVVERMAEQQMAAWNEQWLRQQARDQVREARENRLRSRDDQRNYVAGREEEAADRTREAREAIEAASSILAATLGVNDAIDWARLKRTEAFSVPFPARPQTDWDRAGGVARSLPRKPDRADGRYLRPVEMLDRVLASRRRRKEAEAQQEYESDLAVWEQSCKKLRSADAADLAAHEAAIARWKAAVEAWHIARNELEAEQAKANTAVDALAAAYAQRAPNAVLDYCQLVLDRSQRPAFVPRNYELEYDAAAKSLIVEMELPTPEDIPTIAEWRYVRKSDEIVSKPLATSKSNDLYDSVVYQLTLRTLHELLEADVIDALDAITFSGWVDRLDRGTGTQAVSFILSVQTTKPQFSAINLRLVEPRECFRSLKGLSASRLNALTPVALVATVSREDARFVAAREVQIEEGDNLATMPWEDFEHLVRQLFEREFASAGGEVRVTQASRDGGVDAVIFDPDPLRGGKMVVQAKRYTNVVGVSAVRDLFGTVQHEGAMKGILVTTSTFGPDAYAFAKGKPITLLSGNNLLSMLAKHGHKVRIDLREAKRVQQAS